VLHSVFDHPYAAPTYTDVVIQFWTDRPLENKVSPA
jgi:hypothetical protein